jgi:hypothetical protein
LYTIINYNAIGKINIYLYLLLYRLFYSIYRI